MKSITVLIYILLFSYKINAQRAYKWEANYLKDSILIDSIEHFLTQECPEKERIKIRRIYSIMPDSTDFQYFVVRSSFCHGDSGSGGGPGCIARFHHGKIEILADASGRDIIDISVDVVNGFRKVTIGCSWSIYEIVFNGKKFEHINYAEGSSLPQTVHDIVIQSNKYFLFERNWEWRMQEIYKNQQKERFFLISGFSSGDEVHLVKSDELFHKNKSLSTTFRADSVFAISSQKRYPNIQVFKNGQRTCTLIFKKNAYFSDTCDIYPRFYYFFHSNYENDGFIKTNLEDLFKYKNGVIITKYNRKINRYIIEKGKIYWSGKKYKKKFRYFHSKR